MRQRLHAELTAALREPALREKLAGQGFVLADKSPPNSPTSCVARPGLGTRGARHRSQPVSARRVLALFGHPGRGGFNEAAVEGARRAERAGQPLRIEWIADTDPQARAARIAALCEPGLDLLIAHGGQGDAPVAEVAPRFPRTQFAVTQGSLTAPNVASYEILQEHSAFLAGVLAGLRAADGRAAHLSGERVRPGLKGRAAYADGVRRASGRDPLTGFCGNQHDPERAHEWTRALAARDARVVFAMMDGGRDGVSRACRETGIWQIGNVIDWVARDPRSIWPRHWPTPACAWSERRPTMPPAGWRSAPSPATAWSKRPRCAWRWAPASRRKNAARWKTGRAGWPAAWRSTAATPAPSSRPSVQTQRGVGRLRPPPRHQPAGRAGRRQIDRQQRDPRVARRQRRRRQPRIRPSTTRWNR